MQAEHGVKDKVGVLRACAGFKAQTSAKEVQITAMQQQAQVFSDEQKKNPTPKSALYTFSFI